MSKSYNVIEEERNNKVNTTNSYIMYVQHIYYICIYILYISYMFSIHMHETYFLRALFSYIYMLRTYIYMGSSWQ